MSNSEGRLLDGGLKSLLVFAATVIILLAMKQAAGIINSIALAAILAISVAPILNWLIKKGIPNGLALLIVIVGSVVIVLAFLVVLMVSLQNVVNTLPEYQDRFQTTINDIEGVLSDAGINTSDIKNIDALSPSNLVDVGVNLATALLNALSSWFFMLLLGTYMLIEALDIPRKLERTLEADSPVPERLYNLTRDVRSYIFMTVWIGALTSVLMTILLLILGVDFAVLWGILAFVMSFVPYVGFVIALVPPTVMGLLESGWTTAIIVVVGFVIVNTLTDNVLKPRIMGQGLNLSPLVIMLALFIWAWILGPMGAILAVPMTIIVKGLFLDSFKDTRWIGNLMMPSEAIDTGSGEDQTSE